MYMEISNFGFSISNFMALSAIFLRASLRGMKQSFVCMSPTCPKEIASYLAITGC